MTPSPSGEVERLIEEARFKATALQVDSHYIDSVHEVRDAIDLLTRLAETLSSQSARLRCCEEERDHWKAKYENAMACIHAVRVSLDEAFAERTP